MAAALCYAPQRGIQSAFMAPTEILAEQHYHTMEKLFEGTGVSVALLTGSTKQRERRELLFALKAGQIHLLIGTHALLSDPVEFQRLGLVITDEQHRFGVAQRALSRQGGKSSSFGHVRHADPQDSRPDDLRRPGCFRIG